MDIVPLTKEQVQSFEPQAKLLAANGIAQSLAFTCERKYLNGIGSNTQPFSIKCPGNRIDIPSTPYWVEINQIGKPIQNSAENCFSAIQKILGCCFLPQKVQLIFLVHGQNGVARLFIGIRSFDKNKIGDEFMKSISSFMKGIWPGMSCKRVRGELSSVQEQIKSYDFIDAVTGIPSMESQYKSTYPATIDTLLAGLNGKDFTYMVIADPVPDVSVESMLYTYRDWAGQAESLKSFNYSENMSEGVSRALSESYNETEGSSHSKQKKSALGLVGPGLLLASALFPPASAITGVLGALTDLNYLTGANLMAELSPSYTDTISKSTSKGRSETNTTSQTNGKAISSNMVNRHMESVSEHLYYHTQRLESGKSIGCWSVGVYLMSKNESDLQSAASQLRSISSGRESIFEPIRIHSIGDVVCNTVDTTLACMDAPIIRVEAKEATFEHPLGNYYNDLRTILTTKELSYFINFPLRSVPGISVVDSSPEFSLNPQKEHPDSFSFGKILYGGSLTEMEFCIPRSSLSRHVLLSGISGGGKTNTVKAMLNNIGKLPFLVIEPAKTEYVDWAIEHNKKHPDNPISIYIPGCKNYKGRLTPKPLKLNPFEIVWLEKNQEPRVLTHIDRLKSTFASAFPMYDILPVLMEDLVYSVYQNKSTDWLTSVPEFGKTLPPTLNSLKMAVDKVIENHQYEERVSRNMKACLNTRIDSLMRGWKGEMLNTIHSTPWNELFDLPAIINLSYVGDDVDKGFLMSLILQQLYEYRQAKAECGEIDFNDDGCKHFTVIEEAHRVMSKCDNMELPQFRTAMMFSNMLSEIRAYSEGFMLVDQVPTRLIPDAIKNTNLKIAHRLVAEDDCQAIGESMGLSKEQRLVLPRLLTGQCIVSSSLSTDIYWIKANKVD